MLLRAQQELDSLPHNPALGLQGGYNWIREIRILPMSVRLLRFLRLQAVQTSQRLVYKRNTLARRLQEELIVVAMQLAVERSELFWREVGVV